MRVPRMNVDVVAAILAVALTLAVVLIMAAVLIQSIDHESILGENITQVLTAISGGLIGVLGSYVGARVQQHNDQDKGNGV
jgi:cyanate permease